MLLLLFIPRTNEISWKIDIQPVCSAAEGVLVSYPCLTDCMNHSSYTSQDSCDGHEMHFIELTCRKYNNFTCSLGSCAFSRKCMQCMSL